MTLSVFPSPQAGNRPLRGGPAARRHLPGHRAFSLLEIIAVLGIIAIIAAAALPALVSRIDYAAQTTEATNLSALAAGLTPASSRQRLIPNYFYISPSQPDWATFIATNIGWQVNAVSNNAVNNQRVFLIDPNLVIGTTIPNPAALPYVQTNIGSGNSLPPSARFIIMSSLCSSPQPTGLPAGLNSGVPASSDFNALWNNPDNTIPTRTSWSWNTWKGHGADIRIQRINLASSFKLLTLTVPFDDATPAPYSIDSTNISFVTPSAPVNAYFLAGTVVNLYYRFTSINTTTYLQASQVLLQDASWVFSGGLWRTAPVPVSSQSSVSNFYANPYRGTSPTNVYNDMINYMSLYTNYAAGNFTSSALRSQLGTATNALNNDIYLLINGH